jgi:hypothetical protein
MGFRDKSLDNRDAVTRAAAKNSRAQALMDAENKRYKAKSKPSLLANIFSLASNTAFAVALLAHTGVLSEIRDLIQTRSDSSPLTELAPDGLTHAPSSPIISPTRAKP